MLNIGLIKLPCAKFTVSRVNHNIDYSAFEDIFSKQCSINTNSIYEDSSLNSVTKVSTMAVVFDMQDCIFLVHESRYWDMCLHTSQPFGIHPNVAALNAPESAATHSTSLWPSLSMDPVCSLDGWYVCARLLAVYFKTIFQVTKAGHSNPAWTWSSHTLAAIPSIFASKPWWWFIWLWMKLVIFARFFITLFKDMMRRVVWNNSWQQGFLFIILHWALIYNR